MNIGGYMNIDGHNNWKALKDAYMIVTQDYKEERQETPWYHNTHYCWLIGSIEELESFDPNKVDWDGVTCYIAGRIEALEKLKEEYINCSRSYNAERD